MLVLNRLKLIRFLGYRKLNIYLVYLGWAPLVLVTFISAVGGIDIAGEWGFVLFSFTISGLFVWLKADTTALNIVKLTITVIIIRVLVIIIFGIVNFKDNKVHHINYPGYAIAKVADSYWLEHKGKKPIKYAGGKDPLGYYLAAYLPSEPMFISGLSIAKSPWVKIKLLKEYGAIFIFEGCHKKLNGHLVDSNIKLINPTCYSIDAANKSHKVKIEFTLAMVPSTKNPKLLGYQEFLLVFQLEFGLNFFQLFYYDLSLYQ